MTVMSTAIQMKIATMSNSRRSAYGDTKFFVSITQRTTYGVNKIHSTRRGRQTSWSEHMRTRLKVPHGTLTGTHGFWACTIQLCSTTMIPWDFTKWISYGSNGTDATRALPAAGVPNDYPESVP